MLAYPKFFHVLAAKNRVASGLPLFRSSLIVSSRFFSYASSIHAEALRELSDADVEACPLVISYESSPGTRRATCGTSRSMFSSYTAEVIHPRVGVGRVGPKSVVRYHVAEPIVS